MGNWVQGSSLDLRQGYFVCWNNFKFGKNDKRSANIEDLDKNSGSVMATKKRKTNQCNFYEFKTTRSAQENTSNPAICEELTTLEDYITDMIIYSEMAYFVFSTFYGNINVYKWMDFKQSKKQFMHTFTSHSRAITSMRMKSFDSATFISTSLDGSIRIWDLDKLIELYCFEIDQSDKGNAMG